jgi:DNA-binding transcriptional regulator YiaG
MSWTPKRIRGLLDHYGGTATAFAERVGVSRYAVSNWLAGRRKPCGLAKRSMSELAAQLRFKVVGQ